MHMRDERVEQRQPARCWITKSTWLSCASRSASPDILLNLNLIGMGLGVGLLPGYTESLTNPAICTRPLAGPAPEIELLTAWRAGNRSPQLEVLLELVVHHAHDD
jgi:DNA-binding transcriptional LysR family regulator